MYCVHHCKMWFICSCNAITKCTYNFVDVHYVIMHKMDLKNNVKSIHEIIRSNLEIWIPNCEKVLFYSSVGSQR